MARRIAALWAQAEAMAHAPKPGDVPADPAERAEERTRALILIAMLEARSDNVFLRRARPAVGL